VVFPPAEGRRYVGVRGWPVHPQGAAEPAEIRSRQAASRTQNPRGVGGRPPGADTAPEGGGTTQRGDPAPGPMRCGTTASGNERMHQ
jgi:hypothetical protein